MVSTIPTPTLVGAAALIDGQGRVLLQKRPMGKHHGGLWEFPGGKVEPGESAVQAVVREIAEELDLAIDQDDLVPLTFASDDRIILLLYTCHRWAGVAQSLDADAIQWYETAQLTGLEMPPLDVVLTRTLNNLF